MLCCVIVQQANTCNVHESPMMKSNLNAIRMNLWCICTQLTGEQFAHVTVFYKTENTTWRHMDDNSFVLSTKHDHPFWTTNTSWHKITRILHIIRLIDWESDKSALKRETVWRRQVWIDQSSQKIWTRIDELRSISPSAIHLISAPGRCPLTSRKVSDLHCLWTHVHFPFNAAVQYMTLFTLVHIHFKTHAAVF